MEGLFCLEYDMVKDPNLSLLGGGGYALVGSCCMCGCTGETMDHHLLYSPMAVVLWSFVFALSGFFGCY
jgi:hypothetical protein